jgi:hypothetical protein
MKHKKTHRFSSFEEGSIETNQNISSLSQLNVFRCDTRNHFAQSKNPGMHFYFEDRDKDHRNI